MWKCLSVCQPWAWGLIHGPKRIENRSWATHYRGPLLIHAGKSEARLGDEGDLFPELPAYEDLVYGAIIGLVDLVDCVRVADCPPDPFAEGPWCWMIDNPRPLTEPVPYRGLQKIFGVPDNVVRPFLPAARDLPRGAAVR